MPTTLKQAIYKVLQDDSKIATAGHLGNLLVHTSQSPYGVFFINPPVKPEFPLITYQEISAAGRMPRLDVFNFTVWGDNYEAIHELIYGLLHEKAVISDTGVYSVQLMWNWAGPVIFDEGYRIYTQVQRYVSVGLHV